MPNNHAYVHWETMHLLAAAIKAAGSLTCEGTQCPVEDQVRSAMGEVTFDDHNQARLPMILLADRGRQAGHQGRLHGRNRVPAK